MHPKYEEREFSRSKNNIPIVICDCNFKKHKEAKIYNTSSSGIYFESGIPIQPGTEIVVKKRNSTCFSNPDLCHVEVVWCEEIHDADFFYRFGIGARYCFSDDYWKWMSEARFAQRNLKVIQGGKKFGRFKRLIK